jgi:hypothetical protein
MSGQIADMLSDAALVDVLAPVGELREPVALFALRRVCALGSGGGLWARVGDLLAIIAAD